jgi:hypothetical protein
MHAPDVDDRRQSLRRSINREAKIQLERGSPPRDCLIADISTGGVKLLIDGYDVPDDFVLVLSGGGVVKECNYQVVWRFGREIGARFTGFARRAAPEAAPAATQV